MITEVPQLTDELRTVITRALETPYTSTSCKDAVKTGNHYQSVSLGSERTTGFRDDRDRFLDQIDFVNKKVLDLGSNLGELSRSARSHGARLVDGFEYDSFFVQTANALNAYNCTTRVSFFERDITDPMIYQEDYDLVLAFSVFHYVAPVLEAISRRTRELLIVETHKLNDNLESSYIAPVRKYLPHYKLLGRSDWGRSFSDDEERAVVAFARDEQLLVSCLR